MKRIIYHWTAGTYQPNNVDKKHYHFLINDKGEIFKGEFRSIDNENCTDGKYAAHTGGGNTASVGIAFCGMLGFRNRNDTGVYPLTSKQCETGFELGARLCEKYNLNLNDKLTIQTHYGFGKRNPNSTSAGKIDIVFLPCFPEIQQDKVESFIFNKVKWYYINKKEGSF